MVTSISVASNGPTIGREKRDKLVHRFKMTCYSSQTPERWQRKEKLYGMRDPWQPRPNAASLRPLAT